MSDDDGSRRYLIGGAAAARAVCCAAPLMTVLGIGLAGAAATVATFVFAGIVFALVVAVGPLAAVWQQRSRRPGPATPTAVQVELMPRRPDGGE